MVTRRASTSADPRVLRSRAALRQAFLDLVEKKPFDEIAVREIAAEAGVTFPTFYRQYSSKEALLGDIAKDELRHMAFLMRVRPDQSDLRLAAQAICAYVEERRSLWTALLTTGAAGVMRSEFVALTHAFVEQEGRINPDFPADMIASYVVSSIFDILAWWLRQPEDYPRELVARYLELLVLRPVNTPIAS